MLICERDQQQIAIKARVARRPAAGEIVGDIDPRDFVVPLPDDLPDRETDPVVGLLSGGRLPRVTARSTIRPEGPGQRGATVSR
jgi:hypothetical protein